MAPFLSYFSPALTSICLLSTSPTRPPCRRLEVCLSPGCVADGAKPTLEKLRALNPLGSGILIDEGQCASACGAGPVVIEREGDDEEGTGPNVVHKRIKDEKLIQLLQQDGVAISEEVLRGYEMYEIGEEAMAGKKIDDAIRLYQESIDISASTVIESIEAQSVTERIPYNLQWLISAYRNLASAKLKVFDWNGAKDAAKKACEASKNLDTASLEVLAEVCAAKKDEEGEYQALKTIFALEEDLGEELPRDVAMRRRNQGFRLASLERMLK